MSTRMTTKQVVYMPAYVHASLKAQNTDMNNLMAAMSGDVEIDYSKLYDMIPDLSKYDLIDLATANKALVSKLQLGNDHTVPYSMLAEMIHNKHGYIYEDSGDVLNEFLNKLAGSSILLSRNDFTEKDTYSFEATEFGLYVILHDGFTDMVVNDNSAAMNNFKQSILDKLFSVFGIAETVRTAQYMSFVKEVVQTNLGLMRAS